MISLTCSNQERMAKPFLFESAWMVENNYIDRLREFWNNKDERIQTLKRIETDAKEW